MLRVGDIVRSHKQSKIVIPYLIVSMNLHDVQCINLIDKYHYTIPVIDLYLWIWRD